AVSVRVDLIIQFLVNRKNVVFRNAKTSVDCVSHEP
nr:hypothetical protein [Tanacetum cinerariifolium]